MSLAAVALGMAVATAVGSIALDVGDNVDRELRSFGANIAVTPAADTLAVTVGGVDFRPAGSGAYLSEAALVNLKKIFWRNNIVAFAPYLDLPVTARGRKTVLEGSWFDWRMQIDKSESFETGLEELHPGWEVRGLWPNDASAAPKPECLVGRRLAEAIGAKAGQTLAVYSATPASSTSLLISGILDTGGIEDDQIFAPLEIVQRMAGLEGKIRRVAVSALTKPEDAFARADVSKMTPDEQERWMCTPYVTSISYQIEQAIPGASAKPVYQVADTEGKILNRVGILMGILAVAALLTAALAVASMMLATVLERRAEIGLFKSLGATNARVATLFLLEASALGLAGGLLGSVAGVLLAKRLSVEIFGLPASVHGIVFPLALALALLVTLAGSVFPLARGLRVSPAMVLRD